MFLSHGHQPEVECFLCWIVSALHERLDNSCFGIWWLSVMDMLASEWAKRKTLNFQLPSMAQERLCLSSLFCVVLSFQFLSFFFLFYCPAPMKVTFKGLLSGHYSMAVVK